MGSRFACVRLVERVMTESGACANMTQVSGPSFCWYVGAQLAWELQY